MPLIPPPSIDRILHSVSEDHGMGSRRVERIVSDLRGNLDAPANSEPAFGLQIWTIATQEYNVKRAKNGTYLGRDNPLGKSVSPLR